MPATNRFLGTAPDPVPAGTDLTICFDNPALGGTTVTITVTNGEGHQEDVDIVLDPEGKGSNKFAVPVDWDLVILSHDTSTDHTVSVSH